jgi:hypothetical protein
MLNLLRRSHELQLNVPMVQTTDYLNTIAPENEPEFPGDEKVERTYRAWMRWNAAMLVHRAQRSRHLPLLLRFTKLVSTTFSRVKTTCRVATRFSYRAMLHRDLMREPSSKDDFLRVSLMASAKKNRTPVAGSLLTRTLDSCQSFGSFRLSPWVSAQ